MRSSNTSSNHLTSSSSRSAYELKMMPTPASPGARSERKVCSARTASSSTASRISSNCCAGVRPSGVGTVMPAAAWSLRPATRTWKNSSRFWLKMARNLARSSRGVVARSASASTRALKSSHDSSRFRYRCSWAPTRGWKARWCAPSMKSSRCAATNANLRPEQRRAHGPSVVAKRRGDHSQRQRRHEKTTPNGVADAGDEVVPELVREASTQDDHVEIDHRDRRREGGAECLNRLVEQLDGDLVGGLQGPR